MKYFEKIQIPGKYRNEHFSCPQSGLYLIRSFHCFIYLLILLNNLQSIWLVDMKIKNFTYLEQINGNIFCMHTEIQIILIYKY